MSNSPTTKERDEHAPSAEEAPIGIKDPPVNPQDDPLMEDTEWQRPFQDSPGLDTLAQTPEPFSPERKHDSPGKIPVQPPAEPPNPNPVYVPPTTPSPGDLPSSNPDVVGTQAAGEQALDKSRPAEIA